MTTENEMTGVTLCITCPNNNSGFCGAVLRSSEDDGADKSASCQHHRTLPAGKQLFAPHQQLRDVYVLCVGWGYRFVQLSDGRRQILNFLLPGDLFSASSVFGERLSFTVRALTAIQVSGMSRAWVQKRLANNPDAMVALAKSCAAEAEVSDKMLIALGKYSAEERIAHLFLHLMKRIAARTVVCEQRYALPLRQQDIADAVGLTPVHVSRILGTFRDRGIAELSNGLLEVFDFHELERLGSLN